ncbi:MAG: Ig-like domain-containing protein [Bacteroidales bacterium]|nr:Ig-like domain-containing protein [Bacteroidales bacterium]
MIIPLMVLVLGCVREVEKNDAFYVEGEFTLYASSGEQETRTVIQEDGRVFWSPEDCINVYYGDKSGKFTSTNTEPAASAEFRGTLGSFTLDGETEFVAAYPYSDENAISGTTLTMTLPAEQTAVEGTFADDLFISVAKSKDYKLHFYNVCGGVQFSLARSDIKKVVFRGNNGESLAGRLTVEFASDGKPQVSGIDDGSTSVTLVAPDGGTFKESSFYYIVLVPQVLREGYTMELYSDVLVGTIKSDSSVTVRRSAWGVLKNLVPDTPSVLDGAIVLERKYMVYSTPDYSSSSFYTSTRFCSPSLSLCFDNGQRVVVGYYDTNYWISYSTERHGVIITCGVYVDQTRNEEWYVQPRVSGEWVQEKVIVNPGGKVQYYSNGEFLGEHEFSASILEGASSLYVAMSPYGWWYTHYHFMDDFKLTTPYQTIADDFNNGALDLTIWEEPVNPDGVFVEDGVVKTIQKRTDQDFGLNSKSISLGRFVPVESVSLDKTSLDISVGGEATLNATVLPENATNKTVSWSSSNESVATVSPSGVVTGVSLGSAIITVMTADGGKSSTCNVTVTDTSPNTIATPEAIDLGLPSGLKWASFNLGASKPEEYGDYYAWGETEPYYSSQDPLTWKEGKEAGYSWASYRWCMGAYNTLTKYCSKSEYGYNGFTDNKTVLDLEDDAAYVNLGGSWRMPTDAEWTELRENCPWTWTTQNGVRGRLVTGSNGNSIFLPAAGYWSDAYLYNVGSRGDYWSSSLNSDSPNYAWYVGFKSGSVYRDYYTRCNGFSVRPVCD